MKTQIYSSRKRSFNRKPIIHFCNDKSKPKIKTKESNTFCSKHEIIENGRIINMFSTGEIPTCQSCLIMWNMEMKKHIEMCKMIGNLWSVLTK